MFDGAFSPLGLSARAMAALDFSIRHEAAMDLIHVNEVH